MLNDKHQAEVSQPVLPLRKRLEEAARESKSGSLLAAILL